MQIDKIPVAKLKAAEYNPRRALKPGDAEYEKLKRSITEFGYVEPVIWNKQTGNVVGGHQRLTVMRDLGITEIDCVVVDLDPMREKALNVALNKIQGEWDKDKLAALLTEFDGSEFDVTLTGFDAAEVDELLNAFYSKEAYRMTSMLTKRPKKSRQRVRSPRPETSGSWAYIGSCAAIPPQRWISQSS